MKDECAPLIKPADPIRLNYGNKMTKLMLNGVPATAVSALAFLIWNPFWLLNLFAEFLGAMVGVKCILACGLWVWEGWLMRQKDLVARYGKDSWAVITGGSDGIGLGIAHRLAMNKINVVLVARNEIKLKEKVAEIKKLYKVKAEYRVADFGNVKTPEFYTKLNETMEDMDVSILVNNVGMGVAEFHNAEVRGVWDQGIINMVPQFMMTKVFLPRFKFRTSRSCVMDNSSIASWAEFADFGSYGATKAFNRAFSQNMGEKFGSELALIS
jgi:17beta-estradiol 17-dehydrogenase / very-long-chain 3-oxoacyl-CoA reductase